VSAPIRALWALLSTWRGRLIVVFLAVQLLVPLTYYTVRSDPHDERYAWRMFSPMRMARCKVGFKIDQQPVDLGATFHEAWLTIAQRGRGVVIEQMAQKLCRANPGKPIGVTLECTYLDRPELKVDYLDLCAGSLF